MAAAERRPRVTKLTCGLIVAGLLVVLIGGFALWYNFYQGRGLSRITGIATKIALPDCVHSPDQIKAISFHKDESGQTVKDVTYVCDGQIFSHEYNDYGLLQGKIEWTYKPEAAQK